MRHWIDFPKRAGTHSRQAHADLPEAGIYEREIGRSGFFGPSSHLHHTHAPTGWIDFEGPLKPRAYDFLQPDTKTDWPWASAPFLNNAHCQIRFWHCTNKMTDLVRNADGDELLFIHAGRGDLFCDYGHLEIREGDYVHIPRGTLWRLEPSEPLKILLIEATNDYFGLPEKGLVGKQAIFDPAMLDVPDINDAFKAQQGEHETRVLVKRFETQSKITYPFNPLDAIGWHGDLSVTRINWRDIRPLMSHRYHLPPSAHTTFVAGRFVVCTFVPRPLESDPGALRVPFYHSNEDFDEVIFYHAGNFFSRDNINPGMVTHHPSGFTHGPHPKAFKAGRLHIKKATEEVAVMIDTRDALEAGAPIQAGAEWADYYKSWQA